MTLPRWFWPALAAVSLAGAVVMGWRADRSRRAAASLALRADSIRAASDSTRMVALDSLHGVLDTAFRAMERRAIQQGQRADSLDRALGRTRVAMVDLAAAVRQLTAIETAPVTEDSLTRKATFTVRQPPYTARAEVALPHPPAEGRLALTVALDTAHIGVRLQCGKVDPFGVRPATVLTTTPSWLSLRLDNVQQAPEICSPTKKPSGTRWALVVAAVGGFLLGRF